MVDGGRREMVRLLRTRAFEHCSADVRRYGNNFDLLHLFGRIDNPPIPAHRACALPTRLLRVAGLVKMPA
jgi:hypothetical protein